MIIENMQEDLSAKVKK